MDLAKYESIGKKMRRAIVSMLNDAGSGHPGGSLSAVEIVVSLYFKEMKFSVSNPNDPARDYFILSKGHACPVLYAALAELGCIQSEELCTLRKEGSRLQGHPGKDKMIPGVEVSTGSLGYGLSIGVGAALGIKKAKQNNRVYVLMGDGEQQEGSIWEAAMSAAHFKLDNICAILDNNKLQIDGSVAEVMAIDPIEEKYKSFGWHSIRIDGHSYKEIFKALDEARSVKNKPAIIIADTVKGKGVSFMENQCDWHGKTPTKEQLVTALKELE